MTDLENHSIPRIEELYYPRRMRRLRSRKHYSRAIIALKMMEGKNATTD